MGSIPQPLETHLTGSLSSVGMVGPIGPVTIAGIPDTFHINIDKLPKIQLGIDPVTLHLDPVELSLSIREIPSVRGHLPADFSVGLSLLGMELLCVRLCGEAQIITEPYRPNPCERCGSPGVALVPTNNPLVPANNVVDVTPAAPTSGSGGGT